MDQLIFASLSHTQYWYEVGMLKVPACTCVCECVKSICVCVYVRETCVCVCFFLQLWRLRLKQGGYFYDRKYLNRVTVTSLNH